MPIYEYRCTSCGNILETMQKVSDPPPANCPACAAAGTMERLVSRTSFQLKGGGWYSDLYASTKKEAKGSGDSKGTDAKDAAAKPATAAAAGSTGTATTPSASPSTPASSSGGKGGGTTP